MNFGQEVKGGEEDGKMLPARQAPLPLRLARLSGAVGERAGNALRKRRQRQGRDK
jgi:hypothetical protein